MTQKTFTFTITLQGTGPTVEDAWVDALVEFHNDPGGVPDDEDVKLIHEETEDSFRKIRFSRPVKIVVRSTLGRPSYESRYEAGETESIDILDDQTYAVYVQFENGEVAFILKDSFEYV